MTCLVSSEMAVPSLPAPHKRALSTGESPAFKLMANDDEGYDEEEKEGDK